MGKGIIVRRSRHLQEKVGRYWQHKETRKVKGKIGNDRRQGTIIDTLANIPSECKCPKNTNAIYFNNFLLLRQNK